MEQNGPVQDNNKANITRWLKRIGWVGFFFFLIKGLVWIAVFYGGLRLLGCEG